MPDDNLFYHRSGSMDTKHKKYMHTAYTRETVGAGPIVSTKSKNI